LSQEVRDIWGSVDETAELPGFLGPWRPDIVLRDIRGQPRIAIEARIAPSTPIDLERAEPLWARIALHAAQSKAAGKEVDVIICLVNRRGRNGRLQADATKLDEKLREKGIRVVTEEGLPQELKNVLESRGAGD
jgi:hypothetical protein